MFLYGFPLGLYFGLVTGVISAVLGSVAIDICLNIKYSDGTLIPSINQQLDLELDESYDRVFELCKSSINSIRRSKIITSDSQSGKIVARIGISFYSWGESISFDVSEIRENSMNVVITSKPILITQVFDSGKNYENIKSIRKFLLSEISQEKK
jgi:hypothetical protein